MCYSSALQSQCTPNTGKAAPRGPAPSDRPRALLLLLLLVTASPWSLLSLKFPVGLFLCDKSTPAELLRSEPQGLGVLAQSGRCPLCHQPWFTAFGAPEAPVRWAVPTPVPFLSAMLLQWYLLTCTSLLIIFSICFGLCSWVRI